LFIILQKEINVLNGTSINKNKENDLKKEFKEEVGIKRCEVRRSSEKGWNSHRKEIGFAFLITRNNYCVL
jgi:hypothetical protein